jgi:GNAT superfamily N-acetyltransferase
VTETIGPDREPELPSLSMTEAAPFESSRLYGFIRSRQLEGTYPGQPGTGVWITTCNRVGRGWGMVPKEAWPATPWPPPEPPGLDELAKTRRVVSAYQRVRDLGHVKRLVDRGMHVGTAVEISADEWYASESGVISMPSSRPDVGHCVCVEKYDDEARLLRFWNSWGADWGDGGYGYLPYDYYDAYVTEASVIHVGIDSYPTEYSTPFVCLTWGRLYFGECLHGIEVYEPTTATRVGWCFAVEAAGFLDVEEMFVMPSYRRKGHGKKLRAELRALARRLGLPTLVWIAHADAADLTIAERFLAPMGLQLIPSPTRWASYLAVPGPRTLGGLTKLPPAPGYPRPASTQAIISHSGLDVPTRPD